MKYAMSVTLMIGLAAGAITALTGNRVYAAFSGACGS